MHGRPVPRGAAVGTDSVLDAFEAECAFETDEREQLCLYIGETLAAQGVDVTALTARHGLGRYELTDQWRGW